nr:nuclease A inhibitor family protein [Oscillatoria laete-virens]
MDELEQQLQRETEGLVWMSESDYPLEPFVWDEADLNPEKILTRTNHAPDDPLEEKDVDAFFAQATQEQDWQNEEERAEVRRYQRLLNFLKEKLTDLKVYRVGETEVDVYVVGRTPEGKVAGIATKAVET